MKVKILHILKSVGGVEIMVRNLVEHTNPDNYEYIIAHDTLEKNYTDKNKTKIKTYNLPIERELSPIKDIKSIIGLIKLIKSEKPDKIHCHSSKAGLIGRIVGFITKTQVLYTPHALSYLSSNNRIKRLIFIFVEKITRFQSTTIFLATSKSEQERGLNELSYKQSRCLRFNNSIPPINIIKNNKEVRPYICTLSRPSFQKNLEMLIKAMNIINKQIPELQLKIVGAGYYAPNTEAIKKLITQFGLEDVVEIIEWCNKEEALNYIDDSKFVVSTSRYEGLPLSIIESLALSKACIVTNVDGNKDLIIDGYNGFLIPNEDYTTFAKKAIELLNDQTLKSKFEKNALMHFNNHFNVFNNINLLEDIYSS